MPLLTEEQRLERIVDKLTSFLGAELPRYEIKLGAFQFQYERIAVINRRLGMFAYETAKKLKEAGDFKNALEMFYEALQRFNGCRIEYRLPNLKSDIWPEILAFAEAQGQRERFQGQINKRNHLDLERAMEEFGSSDVNISAPKKLVITTQKQFGPDSEQLVFAMTADSIALKTYSPKDLVRYTSDFQAMWRLYTLAGLEYIASFCYNLTFDHDAEHNVEIVDGNVVVTRTELHSLVTPFKSKNIDALVALGFEASSRRVTYKDFAGSTQLWDDPLNFYVGDDYVVGECIFKQPHGDIRIIDDDILVMLLEKGLPIPKIEPDGEMDGQWYILELKGTDAPQVYGQIKLIRGEILGLRERTPYSKELITRNGEIVGQRLAAKMQKVLRPPCMNRLLYDERKEGDKAELLNAFQELMVAVRSDQKEKYGPLVDAVKTAAVGLRYDPGNAITNILHGKFLVSIPK